MDNEKIKIEKGYKMNRKNLTRGGTLFKPLLVLLLSIALLLSGAALPTREAKAAPIIPTPTREMNLSNGSIDVQKNEVVRVYQNLNSGTTSNKINVPEGVNATIILENLNFDANTNNFLAIRAGCNIRIILKGTNKATVYSGHQVGIFMHDKAQVTIEDGGNGSLEARDVYTSEKGNGDFIYPVIGATYGGTASLRIKSGKIVTTSRYFAPGIGADGDSTLNLTIDDPAVIEGVSNGEGAVIGTAADANNSNVNVTINGGTIKAENNSNRSRAGGAVRAGACIGTAYSSHGTSNVTLNIPRTSTAKLSLKSYWGAAGIGTGGDQRVDSSYVLAGPEAKQTVTANIDGGKTDIKVMGQAAGIGAGATANYKQTVVANIGGGDITIKNDLYTEDKQAGDTTGPAIGVGLLTQNANVTCNVTGGDLKLFSLDKGDKLATSPAVGIGAMNKKNPTTSKWTQAKNNTVNFNVKGGNVTAETHSSDKTIMDVGAIENNALNVKVDGGSFNVVNGQMNVTAQNSTANNVYPATIGLGNISSDNTTVDNATIDGKSYGSGLKTQSGKLYLWTTPGANKKINASVAGDSRAYANPGASLAYSSGFTFTDPNVSLKKTVVPADLGRFSIKSVGEDNVTVQVNGVVSGVPVAIQAFDHTTGQAVGNPQNVISGKTDYTFTGLSKNKTYDIKTAISDKDNYWEAESAAFMVKPFAYAPELASAKLRGHYEGSVALENGSYTYTLAEGSNLPEGLKFANDGRITGTATATGTATFDVIATAVDEGIASGNTRTATVTLNVVPITTESTVVDELGQPLEGCNCKIESKTASDEIGVGDVVAYTVTPCPRHEFVKLNLNGNDIQAGVKIADGIAKYSYTVKQEDTKLAMKAFMAESELRITGLEKVGEAPDLNLFANDEKNTSAEQLRSYIDHNIILKATYNDGTTKNGKASDLGLNWATNDAYNLRGNIYHYSVSDGGAIVEQVLTVNSVTAELDALSDVVRKTNSEGYPTIEALGLPETVGCKYPAGVTVSAADRQPTIHWTTEVPQDFGKTATEAPVVFEGTAAVPEWATIVSAAVSVNVSISDKVVLIPEIKIADKVYDGTTDAVVAETPALDPASLTEGTEVRLEGTAVAAFNAADVGNNISVKVTGLTLTGADAGKYSLDLNQATGNIIPATITLSDITLEDKTVTEDGTPQTLEIKGTLPEGVSVSYTYEKEGSGEAVSLPPSVPGTYTVTATFKTDANHVVDPETMSAKLVIKEKTAGVVVEEITTGLTEEQAAGMNATILKNGEAVQVGDAVVAGDKLTYQFVPAAVREAYVPYAFTMNGETVAITKLAEGKGYSAEYTVKEGDTALKADAKCVLLGNFSGDDKINILDAQQIAQAAAAGGSIEDMKKVAGDVNFDGKINVIDAQRVAQYAADTSVVF